MRGVGGGSGLVGLGVVGIAFVGGAGGRGCGCVVECMTEGFAADTVLSLVERALLLEYIEWVRGLISS